MVADILFCKSHFLKKSMRFNWSFKRLGNFSAKLQKMNFAALLRQFPSPLWNQRQIQLQIHL